MSLLPVSVPDAAATTCVHHRRTLDTIRKRLCERLSAEQSKRSRMMMSSSPCSDDGSHLVGGDVIGGSVARRLGDEIGDIECGRCVFDLSMVSGLDPDSTTDLDFTMPLSGGATTSAVGHHAVVGSACRSAPGGGDAGPPSSLVLTSLPAAVAELLTAARIHCRDCQRMNEQKTGTAAAAESCPGGRESTAAVAAVMAACTALQEVGASSRMFRGVPSDNAMLMSLAENCDVDGALPSRRRTALRYGSSTDISTSNDLNDVIAASQTSTPQPPIDGGHISVSGSVVSSVETAKRRRVSSSAEPEVPAASADTADRPKVAVAAADLNRLPVSSWTQLDLDAAAVQRMMSSVGFGQSSMSPFSFVTQSLCQSTNGLLTSSDLRLLAAPQRRLESLLTKTEARPSDDVTSGMFRSTGTIQPPTCLAGNIVSAPLAAATTLDQQIRPLASTVQSRPPFLSLMPTSFGLPLIQGLGSSTPGSTGYHRPIAVANAQTMLFTPRPVPSVTIPLSSSSHCPPRPPATSSTFTWPASTSAKSTSPPNSSTTLPRQPPAIVNAAASAPLLTTTRLNRTAPPPTSTSGGIDVAAGSGSVSEPTSPSTDPLESMTVASLRDECRRLRLPTTGPKPNLVRRLRQNLGVGVAVGSLPAPAPVRRDLVVTSPTTSVLEPRPAVSGQRTLQPSVAVAAAQVPMEVSASMTTMLPDIDAASTPPTSSSSSRVSLSNSQAIAARILSIRAKKQRSSLQDLASQQSPVASVPDAVVTSHQLPVPVPTSDVARRPVGPATLPVPHPAAVTCLLRPPTIFQPTLPRAPLGSVLPPPILATTSTPYVQPPGPFNLLPGFRQPTLLDHQRAIQCPSAGSFYPYVLNTAGVGGAPEVRPVFGGQSLSPTAVPGIAVRGTPDAHQVSLCQQQQKLIEDLQRQLEQSRRALLEVQQQQQQQQQHPAGRPRRRSSTNADQNHDRKPHSVAAAPVQPSTTTSNTSGSEISAEQAKLIQQQQQQMQLEIIIRQLLGKLDVQPPATERVDDSAVPDGVYPGGDDDAGGAGDDDQKEFACSTCEDHDERAGFDHQEQTGFDLPEQAGFEDQERIRGSTIGDDLLLTSCELAGLSAAHDAVSDDTVSPSRDLNVNHNGCSSDVMKPHAERHSGNVPYDMFTNAQRFSSDSLADINDLLDSLANFADDEGCSPEDLDFIDTHLPPSGEPTPAAATDCYQPGTDSAASLGPELDVDVQGLFFKSSPNPPPSDPLLIGDDLDRDCWWWWDSDGPVSGTVGGAASALPDTPSSGSTQLSWGSDEAPDSPPRHSAVLPPVGRTLASGVKSTTVVVGRGDPSTSGGPEAVRDWSAYAPRDLLLSMSSRTVPIFDVDFACVQ